MILELHKEIQLHLVLNITLDQHLEKKIIITLKVYIIFLDICQHQASNILMSGPRNNIILGFEVITEKSIYEYNLLNPILYGSFFINFWPIIMHKSC